MKRLIVYDLDGTLVDTAEDITRSMNHMLGELGRRPMSRGEIVPFIGTGLRPLVVSCLKTDDPQLVEQGMTIYRTYYTQHLLDHTALYPSAQLVLEHFKDRKQAVVTNKPHTLTQQILTGLGVARYFIEVIAGDSGYPRKPDPAGVRSVMDRNRVGADETVLVGDSRIDIDTGRNAGVLTVVVTHGFGDAAELRASAPDAVVHDFEELIEVATRLEW